MSNEKMVDLSVITEGRVHSLIGQQTGTAAREKLRLDSCDDLDEPVTVKVPESLEAITGSFFQGLFAKSVQKLDNRFFDHYQFDASPMIMSDIRSGVRLIQTRRDLSLL